MPLSVQSRRVGDITVMMCRGRIVEGSESSALQQHVGVPSQDPCIVLNLCDVDFIDSSGLGLLVRLLTRCRAAGGDLKLCAVPGRIDDRVALARSWERSAAEGMPACTGIVGTVAYSGGPYAA